MHIFIPKKGSLLILKPSDPWAPKHVFESNLFPLLILLLSLTACQHLLCLDFTSHTQGIFWVGGNPQGLQSPTLSHTGPPKNQTLYLRMLFKCFLNYDSLESYPLHWAACSMPTTLWSRLPNPTDCSAPFEELQGHKAWKSCLGVYGFYISSLLWVLCCRMWYSHSVDKKTENRKWEDFSQKSSSAHIQLPDYASVAEGRKIELEGWQG